MNEDLCWLKIVVTRKDLRMPVEWGPFLCLEHAEEALARFAGNPDILQARIELSPGASKVTPKQIREWFGRKKDQKVPPPSTAEQTPDMGVSDPAVHAEPQSICSADVVLPPVLL